MSKEAQPPQGPKNPHPQKPCPKVPPSRRKSGTVYREILAPVLFLPLSSSLSMNKLKTGQNAMAKTISLSKQLWAGKFKTFDSDEGRKLTRGKNITA